MTDLKRIRFGAPVETVMAAFREDGGVILENVLTLDQIAAINRDVDAAMECMSPGTLKDDPAHQAFVGMRTKRLTNTVTLSPTYRNGLLDSDVLMAYATEVFRGVCDSLWLQSSQVIEIHPGEKAQPLHRDMGNYPVFFRFGPTGPEVTLNVLLALTDCSEEAGATRVIPGSHRWEFSENGTPDMTVPAVLKAGSAIFFSGKLVHGGGANRTADFKRRVVSSAFNPGFLVPEEAFPFVVPMEVARQMSPRLQQLVGFRSFHQREPRGGSLWQHNFEELALHLNL